MAFPSSPVLDNFNRASLGANWTGPFLDAAVLTNPNGTQLPGAPAATFNDGYYNALSGLNGQTVEVYISAPVRIATVSAETVMVYFLDASKNGYAVEFDGTGITYFRVDAGAQTSLGTTVITLANGDVVGMKYTPGGTIEAYKNGSLISSASDATYSGMDRIGIESGNNATIRLDDFGGGIAGSLAVGAAVRPVRIPNKLVGPQALRRLFRRALSLAVSAIVAPVTDSGNDQLAVTPAAAETIIDLASNGPTFVPSGAEVVVDQGANGPVVAATQAETVIDAGTVTVAHAPSGADAIADQAADVATVTATGAQAFAEAGTITSTGTATDAETIIDQAVAAATATPTAAELVIDQGATTGTGSPSGADATADGATVTATGTAAGSGATSDQGAAQATGAPGGAETVIDQAALTAAFTPSQAEIVVDQAADAATVTPSGNGSVVTGSSDQGTVTATFTTSATEIVVDLATMIAAVAATQAETIIDQNAIVQNYLLNGDVETNLVGVTQFAGISMIRVADAKYGTWAVQSTNNGSGSGQAYDTATGLAWPAGKQLAAGVWVKAGDAPSVGLTINVRIRFTNTDATITDVGTKSVVLTNQYQFVAVTGQVAAGKTADKASVLVINSAIGVLVVQNSDGAQLEDGALAHDFWSGPIVVAPTGAEATVDAATVTAAATPAGTDARAEQGATTATATVAGSEIVYDAGSVTASTPAAAAQTIIDQGATGAVATGSGVGAPIFAGAGTVTVTVTPSGSISIYVAPYGTAVADIGPASPAAAVVAGVGQATATTTSIPGAAASVVTAPAAAATIAETAEAEGTLTKG